MLVGEGLSSWCSTKEWIFTSWLLILNLSSAIFLHLHLSVGSSTESHHELRMVGVYWSGGIINIRSTEIDFTKLQLSGVHHFLRPFSQLQETQYIFSVSIVESEILTSLYTTLQSFSQTNAFSRFLFLFLSPGIGLEAVLILH